MKKILITGFEPFANYEENPSWEAVEQLPDRIHDYLLIKLKLPVVFDLASSIIEKKFHEERPDIILLTGLSAKRDHVSIERVALNIKDASIPDNNGVKPQDTIIDYSSPSCWYTNLPAKKIISSMRKCGFPCEISNTAGTYVCNEVFFKLMSLIHYRSPDKIGGFIHVPPLEAKFDKESTWTIERLTKSLECIIHSCITSSEAESCSSKLSVVPYNPDWPKEFEEIRSSLIETLGHLAFSVDHIGSTSIPGLAAKDIIDIQISVKALNDELLTAMESLGYKLVEHVTSDHIPAGMEPDPKLWRKWFFKAPANQRKTNTHIRIAGNPNQMYPLLFRDYLRNHPKTASSYGEFKLRLAANISNPSMYPDVKDPAVDLIFFPALQWAETTHWKNPVLSGT
jgi:pyroglutamyl-peptidase I